MKQLMDEDIFDNRKRFQNSIFSLLLFLTPFCYPFRTFINRLIPIHVAFWMYITLVLMAVLLVIEKRELYISKWILLVLLWDIVFLPFSADYSTGLKWIINVVLGLIIGGTVMRMGWKIEKALPFSIGACVCGFLLLPDVVKWLGFSQTYLTDWRIPFMEGDITIGPNSWAQTLSLSILVLCIIIIEKKKNLLLLLVVLGILFYYLILTQSRTQIYALIIVLAFMLFRIIWDKRQKVEFRLLSILLIGFSVIIAILTVISSINQITSVRILYFDLNGRNEIWDMVADTFLNKMSITEKLFGAGTGSGSVFLAQNNPDLLTSETSDHISTHNIYFDSLISMGLIGTIISVGYWIRATYILAFNNRKSMYFIIPLFILVSGLGTHLFMNWEYSIYIALTEALICKYGLNKNSSILFTIGKK